MNQSTKKTLWTIKLDTKAIVKEYFGLGFMMAPNTIYKKIYQVKPGEIVKINNIGKITRKLMFSGFMRPDGAKIRRESIP